VQAGGARDARGVGGRGGEGRGRKSQAFRLVGLKGFNVMRDSLTLP
jgi:hypothetical protein